MVARSFANEEFMLAGLFGPLRAGTLFYRTACEKVIFLRVQHIYRRDHAAPQRGIAATRVLR
jgi:hypothetical protein